MIKSQNIRTDKELLEDIYITYKQYMLKVAYNIVKKQDDAEEAVQNAVIKIAEHIERFRDLPDDDTSKLIYVIQKNEALMLLRSNSKNEHEDIEEYSETVADSGTEAGVDNKLLRNELDKVMSQLDEKSKYTVELYYYYGMSEKEIASVLGITENTVYKRLKKAIRILSDKFQNRGNRK